MPICVDCNRSHKDGSGSFYASNGLSGSCPIKSTDIPRIKKMQIQNGAREEYFYDITKPLCSYCWINKFSGRGEIKHHNMGGIDITKEPGNWNIGRSKIWNESRGRVR